MYIRMRAATACSAHQETCAMLSAVAQRLAATTCCALAGNTLTHIHMWRRCVSHTRPLPSTFYANIALITYWWMRRVRGGDALAIDVAASGTHWQLPQRLLNWEMLLADCAAVVSVGFVCCWCCSTCPSATPTAKARFSFVATATHYDRLGVAVVSVILLLGVSRLLYASNCRDGVFICNAGCLVGI